MVTSNSRFSKTFLKAFVLNSLPYDKILVLTKMKVDLFADNKFIFDRVENVVEMEKILVTSLLSFSNSVFYLFGKLSPMFIKFEIDICKVIAFERV